MDSRNLICWSILPLTTKMGLNSPQYHINLHMGHYGPNSKLGRMSGVVGLANPGIGNHGSVGKDIQFLQK